MSEIFSTKNARQLAVFMDDRPGSLARVCDALARGGINIEALASEGGTFAGAGESQQLVRMVVSDATKALSILNEMSAVAVENEVIVIEGSGEPGTLARIAERLTRAEINIESVYVSSTNDAKRCVIIIRPSNVEAARRALSTLQ
jgi:hypothetical protein